MVTVISDLGDEAVSIAADLIVRFEAGEPLSATEHAVVAFLLAAAHQERCKKGDV